MINKTVGKGYFSISFELISLDCSLPFDLYVNSSSVPRRERYVKVFPRQGILSKIDVAELKIKYVRLFVKEADRKNYLKSITCQSHIGDKTKVEVLKDSAIKYLSNLFDGEKETSAELLGETIQDCKEVVESMVDVLQDYSIDDIQQLIGEMSFHDFYTYDHSINVSMYCISLHRILKDHSSREDLVSAGLGGLLHDIGKIKIATSIINKPGKLTEEEFSEMKHHPSYGLKILEESACHCEGVNIQLISKVVYEHHEAFGGGGYPRKLEGNEIHFLARLTSIADFFDAITTKRSYNEVLDADKALALMSGFQGKQLDPQMFTTFKKSMEQVLKSSDFPWGLAEDIDPCRPFGRLPLKKILVEEEENLEDENDFGKIIHKTSKAKKTKAN